MCDRTDEQLYDLEFKHTKSQKEEEELQKRISDIKCKFLFDLIRLKWLFLCKKSYLEVNCGHAFIRSVSIFESTNDIFIINE